MSFTPEELNRLFWNNVLDRHHMTFYHLDSVTLKLYSEKLQKNILDNSGIFLEKLGTHFVFLVQC